MCARGGEPGNEATDTVLHGMHSVQLVTATNTHRDRKLKSVRVHLAPGSKAVKTVYTSTRHNWNVKNICGERSTRKLAPAHDVYTTSAND